MFSLRVSSSSSFGRFVALLGCVGLLTLGTGCGPAIRQASTEVPKSAVPATIDAGLGKLAEPDTQNRIADIFTTPEMKRVMHEMSSGISEGVLDGVTSDHSRQQMAGLVAYLTHAVVAALKQELANLGPTVSEIAKSSVNSAFDAVLSPENEAKAARYGAGVTRAMGPAFADLLRTPELKAAVGDLTKTIAYEAVNGSTEAMAEQVEARRNHGTGPLATILEFFSTRLWLVALLGATLVFAIPIVWLVRERSRANHYRVENERQRARAEALLEVLDAAADEPWSANLGALLKDRIREASRAPSSETRPRRQAAAPLSSRHAT